MNIRWRNVPLPEPYLIALAAGAVLQAAVPWLLPVPSVVMLPAGVLLVAIGLGLIAWAVQAAQEVEVARPSALITHGPYARSRNPMYLGWTALALGIALLVGSVWMALAVAGAWIYLHAVTIPAEEASLRGAFGDAYRAYSQRVRRWL